MISASTHTIHGLTILDPSSVKMAQRQKYWLHTGQAMQDRGLYQGPVDFDSLYEIEDAFRVLPQQMQHDLLQQHRHRAVQDVMAEHYRTRFVNEINMDERPLRWSYIRDTLFAGLENAQDVLANHKETAHSYANAAVSSRFENLGSDRLYLPMSQFAPHNSLVRDDMMVLSRNPYDLARCSSYRAWTNCMDPDKKNYSHYVSGNIRQGTIVSYRVKGNAEDWRLTDWNIDAPVNRCLMQPYRDRHNNILYLEDYSHGESGSTGKVFQEAATLVRRELFSLNAKVATKYHMEENLYTGNMLHDLHITTEDDIPARTKQKNLFAL